MSAGSTATIISNGGADSLTRHSRAGPFVAEENLRNAVGFDQGDAGTVISAADDRGVIAGAKKGVHDGGFAVIGWSEIQRSDSLDLRIFPIVIERDARAVAVEELEGRVEERIGNPKAAERRTKRAEHHDRAIAIADDDAGNHDVVTRADETAGAEIRQRRAIAGRHIVSLDHAVPGSAILSSKLSGVLSRRERGDDGGLFVVRRRETAVLDLSGIR